MFFCKKEKPLAMDNIQLDCKASDKYDAIKKVGHLLKDRGYIKDEYIKGMINREDDLTTYIGNKIAIPHGEFEVKDYVIKTGLAVMIYPNPIDWDGNEVNIVIGIAAKDDEHLKILSNIAEKLSDETVVEQFIKGDKKYIYNVLTDK